MSGIMSTQELPPLPEPTAWAALWDPMREEAFSWNEDAHHKSPLFTEDQMRAYALAALASQPAAAQWLPIDIVPKDGTEVALLFAREEELHGRIYPRVRAARWVGDWSIPYFKSNPPIGWHSMPPAPALFREGEGNV